MKKFKQMDITETPEFKKYNSLSVLDTLPDPVEVIRVFVINTLLSDDLEKLEQEKRMSLIREKNRHTTNMINISKKAKEKWESIKHTKIPSSLLTL